MLATLAGCVDYDLDRPPPDYGAPNPPPLEGTTRVDRILQVPDTNVDVLWVVDNSCSMIDDNARLAYNFPRFVQPFVDSGVDWHIGVVTTDMNYTPWATACRYCGQLIEQDGQRFLTPSSPDPVGTFTAMATNLAQSFTGLEEGRLAAWTALEVLRSGYNRGFLHDDPGAWLHIVVVTDEDDDSPPDPVGRDEFVDWLHDLRPHDERTTFSSVVALSDYYPEERGQRYIDLTDRIGGGVYSLKSDWNALLGDLANLQLPPPTDEFFLSAMPVPDTLDVHVFDAGITYTFHAGDYEWSPIRNSIRFVDWQPPLGSTVEIAYELATSVR